MSKQDQQRLLLFIRNQPQPPQAPDDTRTYLDAAGALDIARSHGCDLDDVYLVGEGEALWYAYLAIRSSVAAAGHSAEVLDLVAYPVAANGYIVEGWFVGKEEEENHGM
jgi:hypothetical protein